jgi:hypothetical protein
MVETKDLVDRRGTPGYLDPVEFLEFLVNILVLKFTPKAMIS